MDGKIPLCEELSIKCEHKCCVFTDNYIVLYPGEYESTEKSKDHLEIIDNDYFGGKKAVCKRMCAADEFKPLDCKSYPLFPRISKDSKIDFLRGTKCPLQAKDLACHRKWVEEIWKLLFKKPEILEWVKKVEMGGYQPI